METETRYLNLIKQSIEEDVFVNEEAKEISKMGSEKMNWLFDFRRVLLKSEILNAYCEIFWERHKDKLPFQICGVEIASVPLIAGIILKFHEKGKPMNGFFIRKSRKKSGLLKMIEGQVTNDPVIIVDDLVNTGSSIMRQIEILENEKKKIEEIFSILRFRNEEYYINFKSKKILFYSLFDLNDFKNSLKIHNLEKKNDRAVVSPFEERSQWIYQGNNPNFFYVVPKSAPVVSDNNIYFGTDTGYFIAVEITTGKELWKYKIPFGSQGKYIFSTPAIYKDIVLFGAYDGNLYALDKENGNKKWVFLEADWIGSSPCVAEHLNLVFVGLEYGLFRKQGGVTAIDVRTGNKKWEFRSPELTHGSPAYSNRFNLVACGSNDGVLYVLNAKTGKPVWNFKTEGPIKYAPTFSDKHGFVVVIGFGETVYVLNSKTGEVISKYKMDFGGYSTPLILGNKVVCTSFDKNVHCFNIFTGKLIWKFDTGARCFSTPTIVEGKIYVGSNNGRVFEINPETGENTGIFYTRERIVNKITYDKKTKIFFIPTFANEIIAVKKK